MHTAPNNAITPPKDKIEVKDFIALTKWVFGTYFRAFPKQTTIYIISAFILELRTIINSFFFAKIIDTLLKATQNQNATINDTLPLVAVLFVYNIADNGVDTIYWHYKSVLDSLADPVIRNKFTVFLKSLGIQTLEQPEVNNKIYRAQISLNALMNYMNQIVRIMAMAFRFTASALIMITISPVLLAIVCVILIPGFFIDKHFRKTIWALSISTTENRRLADMSANDIATSKSLLEIVINGSFEFFRKKYYDYFIWFRNKEVGILTKWQVSGYLANLPNEVTLGFGLILIIKKLLAGAISLGDVVFQYRIVDSFQSTLTQLSSYINNLFEFSLRIKDLYELFMTKPTFEDGTIEMPLLENGPEIELKNLNFSYPNTEALVLENIKLKIKSGEKVAIVGHNGAGKTTLVKLICRVYKASEGSIIVNGTNINDYKIDTFYRNTGILMQDFNVHPQLTPRENIYVGDATKELSEVDIRLAAQSADATDFIEHFPNKFDQVLSEKMKGGVRPSTGQWQKLAIARFFYRNAPLVIFDEPTAAIDAVSEYNIFNKIYEFFRGKTVIIISHRFSTVRNADRIIVMDHGKAVEEGTHSELIAKDGLYAKAFMLQAQGYAKE